MTYAEQFEDRWFWETDADGRLTYLSKNVAEQVELFGLNTVGELITNVFRIDEKEHESARSLQFLVVSRSGFTDLSVCGRKGLSDGCWSMSGRPWFDEQGGYRGFVGSGVDLTKTRKQEATIRRLAAIDSLTGLANRESIQGTLRAWFGSPANDGQSAALLMLDLDGFKAVNDTLGHPAGDSLLTIVGERLLKVVGDEGAVGRLGGDEFLIFLPMEGSRRELSDLSSHIIDAISEPYMIEGRTICVGCSIGISIADEGERSSAKLVRNADIALYSAKAGGRSTYRFFENDMLIKAKRKKELEDDLRFALNSDQLILAYQPIVETGSHKLVGFEALLRWDHPERGSISPDEFIPIAEESGLIQGIGDWVLRTAGKDLSRLPSDLRIAVNISAIQFRNPALLATLANVIGQNQIDPQRLELEITETVFLKDEQDAQSTFIALKSLGLRLALDDFGTGYSSLAYLKSAPFDKIKIDKAFVRGATDPESRNLAIMRSIVSLAQSLGMETTAEGVEYQDEVRMVESIGCSHIQGFVYGSAQHIDDLLPRLNSGSRTVGIRGHERKGNRRKTDNLSANIHINDGNLSVEIVDYSSCGALINGVYWSEEMVGVIITIEIENSNPVEAQIRWVGKRKAGVEFLEPLEIEIS